MNVFLPFDDSIERSVAALDDRRLVKQILEIKVLLDIVNGEKNGYENHPVAKHYREYPGFLTLYGMVACAEFRERFGHDHQYAETFEKRVMTFLRFKPFYVPFYAAYPAGDPRCIRTTKGVGELFRQKLIRKWDEDKLAPTWTRRPVPDFYKKRYEEVAK